MRRTHAGHGQKGTFAQFGDSITVTRAFWGPLRYSRKNLDPAAAKAFRGRERLPAAGSAGTAGRARVRQRGRHDDPLAAKKRRRLGSRAEPETARSFSGRTTWASFELPEYEAKTREVVQRVWTTAPS